MRYFDLHCDTASVCFKKYILPDDNSLAASVSKGQIFDDWCQCYAIFIDDNSDEPRSDYHNILGDFKRKTAALKMPRFILTLENASAIDSLEFVDRISADGIRAVTLTWNGENALAGGAYADVGLKPFGRQVISALNKKKIAVDLSHLNRKSFYKAGEAADTVFASHSCCDKTHNHPRNLTDEQLLYIARRGGVIGVCFYPEFLGTKYSFEGVWRHINHLLNIGLENSISIGSDFDGADMSKMLDGVDKIPDLCRFLLKRGIGANLLEKIFFDNAELFFKNF